MDPFRPIAHLTYWERIRDIEACLRAVVKNQKGGLHIIHCAFSGKYRRKYRKQ